MTGLNAVQADALAELINIAFGLTAAKLSEISGHRVVLGPPVVASHNIDDLSRELDMFGTGEVISVHQVFTGPFSGDAILFLNYQGALELSNLLVGEHLQSQRLDPSSGEILTEVGNMLLSACLGVFGNLLQMHVSFSIPQLHRDSLQQFLNSLTIAGDELKYAVVITSSFLIRENGVNGRVAIILGVSSLQRLIQAVDQWEGNQLSSQ